MVKASGRRSRRSLKKGALSPNKWRLRVLLTTVLSLSINATYYLLNSTEHIELSADHHFYVFIATVVLNIFLQLYFLKIFNKRLKSFRVSSPNLGIRISTLVIGFLFPLFFLILNLKLFITRQNSKWTWYKEYLIAFLGAMLIAGALSFAPNSTQKFLDTTPITKKIAYYNVSPTLQLSYKAYLDHTFIERLKNNKNDVCAKSADKVNCAHKRLIQYIRNNNISSLQTANAISLSASLAIKERDQKLKAKNSSFVVHHHKLYAMNLLINQKIDYLQFSCSLNDFYDLTFPYGVYALSGSLEHALILLNNVKVELTQFELLKKDIEKNLRKSNRASKSKVTYTKFRERFEKLKASECSHRLLTFQKYKKLFFGFYSK